MNVGELCNCSDKRGLIASLFYPVCLVQEFKSTLQSNVIEYFGECDQVKHEFFKDRIQWLDSNRIKYKFEYHTTKYSGPSIEGDASTTFVLRLSFAKRSDAEAYKATWS